ncbi:major facilitator superfamily domain-containing protein [Melampsora americana]|nr:major facilitator superfamily domain-containing protein [Melampsora americana]
MTDLPQKEILSDHSPSKSILNESNPTPNPKITYHHPLIQIIIISFVCFCCPGMYNSITGLGGGGQLNAKAADDATFALCVTFAIVAFFSGSIVNKLGPKFSMTIGCTGYTFFIGSYLYYNHTQQSNVVIAAGAFLGLSAALLWTAQGALMLAYSTEATKGRYIAMFWFIYNLGAVLGDAIALGRNRTSTADISVPDSIYIVFICITICGIVSTFTLADPSTVRRSNAEYVILQRNLSWKSEFKGMSQTLTKDPMVLLLFPFFWASTWFYTYLFNDFNLVLFNLRTRSLDALLYWISQLIGSSFLGFCLDLSSKSNVLKSPRRRGLLGWFLLTSVLFGTWGGGWVVQKGFDRQSVILKMDWSDEQYTGRVILYIFYGIMDSMWQTYAYWIMAAFSDDPRTITSLVGFYKGIQAAGAAVIYRIDANEVSYKLIFLSSWALLAFGIVCLLPILFLRIKVKV